MKIRVDCVISGEATLPVDRESGVVDNKPSAYTWNSLDTQSDRHASRHRDVLVSGADDRGVYGSASHMASRNAGTNPIDEPSKVSGLAMPVSDGQE